ncbi:TLC domain-containing protein [Aspergillus coremiiformis]|uniref:TLC domain-containing protein n=1 Tax=Aspergillus coremiiformis TaxID=138285 RepID=A0A5N6Z1W7_9EURO|nr:TLC domain-containing protein [Aspergillus coremiiformis]
MAHKPSGLQAAKPWTRSRSRPDGYITKLARWLLDNQIGLSSTLIACLLLTHLGVPSLRPYTSRFFRLSYYNPRTKKYASGFDDFYFMSFWTILLTGLRAGVIEYILAPLARRWGVSRRKDATRFAEQGWMVMYYNVVWPLGMYLYSKSPYFLNMEELWTEWPQRELDGLVKAYFLGQWSFWVQQILVIHIEDRRKDHWQMLTHHFVTIALMAASYAYHQARVGHLILVLMDVIDLFLPLAKCLKYLGHTTICDILFGGFIISWLIARHLLFLKACWSIYFDSSRIIAPGCYRGTAEALEGPFPVPSDWSHLIEPFRNPAGTVCWNQNIIYGFLSFLLCLQVMMLLWFTIIVRIALRIVQGNRAEDLRSEGEEDEQDEKEEEHERAPPLGKEVSENGIGWKEWEHYVDKGAATGSGARFPSHRARKELLNRIGCDKHID